MQRLLGLMVAAALLLAAPALPAVEATPATSLFFRGGDEVRTLATPLRSLTPEQAAERLAEFRPVADLASLEAGREYWIHARLKNRLAHDREFRVELKQWGYVDAWMRGPGDGWQALPSSGAYSGRHSGLANANPYTQTLGGLRTHFPVAMVNSGAEIELLFRARDNFLQSPNILVPWYSDHALALELRRYGLTIEGLMLGILVAVAVFGAYSAFTNRDRTSLLYGVWILFALLSASTIFVHDGSRLFEFIVDIEGIPLNHNALTMVAINTLGYGQAIGYVLFARSFLEMKTHMPWAYRFSNLYVAASLAHWAFRAFVPHGLSGVQVWGLYSVMVMLMFATLLACAWLRHRQGLQVARFFLIALVPYLFFRGVFVLGLFLPIPSPFSFMEPAGIGLFLQHTSIAQAFGVCCEALIMGLAVFRKNRWLQDELKQKMQAQAELVATQNQRLEATVAERTRELVASKADTERQHLLVTDSIRYASRLQKALLPRGQRLQGAVRSWHAIWEPRDTIGGDVWWVSPPDAEGRVTVVLADSTGHGVPGAMLSVLVSTSLERIHASQPAIDPGSALMALDAALRAGLNQDSHDAESDDGCDAAMVRIDPVRQVIEYAGAKLALLHLREDGTVERVQASRLSLGYREPPHERPQVHRIAYRRGDSFVLVSDGFTDQVGSPDGTPRAYGYRRLQELLRRMPGRPAGDIADAMREDLRQWQGSQMRRDDVTAVVFQPA